MSHETKDIKISLIVVKNEVKGLKINEQSFAFPEGIESLEFTTDELLRTRPNGVQWFSDRLKTIAITIKRQLLSCLMDIGENCSFSKCSVADSLDISREMNKEIMKIALSCGVIGPRGNQFRLKSGVVSELKRQLDILNREEGIETEPRFKPTTAKEMVEKARQIAKEIKTVGEEEEYIEVVEPVKTVKTEISQLKEVRTLQEVQKELAIWLERTHDPEYRHEAVNKVNALKAEINTLQIQSSSLLSSRLATSQLLPKKKPAPLLPPVPGKKSQKSLK